MEINSIRCIILRLQYFKQHQVEDLIDKTEIGISEAIKNPQMRKNLIDTMNDLKGYSTGLTAGCAYKFAEELAEIRNITLEKVGDFYEIYGEEAVEAARVLEVTLTRRHNENGDIPMTGFPAYAVEQYVKKLENSGVIVNLPINRVEKIDTVERILTEQEQIPKQEQSDKSDLIVNIEKLKPTRVDNTVIYPEIPMSERHNFRITDDNLGIGDPKEKFKNNITAIEMLKMLEEEHRLATPEEQEILSRYVGWGGLSDAFDETKDNWHTEYIQLKNLLTDNEYTSARESSLTAFYTPPVVIRSIYNALENMGLKSGNILDPSMGIGNFEGMMPDSLSSCKVYGIELDSISGRIAQQLYQKNSVAIQGYEDTTLPDSFFDAAVGNIPFGDFKVLDKKCDKHNFLIHDYFFAKTLDNEEKTSLDNIIDYAANPTKTEQRLFESAINCSSVENTYTEMMATKRKFGKIDKVLAYHYIQSFKPGEVTSELAHKIGMEFAQECFGDRFEIVIGTHLDKSHLHNHIIVNAQSGTVG